MPMPDRSMCDAKEWLNQLVDQESPKINVTGKSLSESLIFASTNPQYEDRLFIELQVQYMKIPSSNLGRTCCVQKLFLTFSQVKIFFSYTYLLST